jgi:hypothetical protein
MARRNTTTLAAPKRGVFPDEGRLRKRVERHKQLQPPLKRKIVKALQHGGYLATEAAEEAAFHLTDWVVELEELIEVFHRPTWAPSRALDVLMGFVIHAPAHLAAAHRIVMGDPVTDVFEIGAVKGSGRAKRKPGSHSNKKGQGPRSPKSK